MPLVNGLTDFRSCNSGHCSSAQHVYCCPSDCSSEYSERCNIPLNPYSIKAGNVGQEY